MAVAFQNPCRIVEISKSYVFLTELIIKISIIFIPRKLLYTKLRIPYHKINNLSLNISAPKKKLLQANLRSILELRDVAIVIVNENQLIHSVWTEAISLLSHYQGHYQK